MSRPRSPRRVPVPAAAAIVAVAAAVAVLATLASLAYPAGPVGALLPGGDAPASSAASGGASGPAAPDRTTTSASAVPAAGSTVRPRVQGNQLVDQDGTPVRLLGFNRSGTEYACIEGWGIFDGPHPTRMPASVVAAMRGWAGANAVRIPLNEQCWLGLGVPAAYGGAAYQRAVREYVDLLHAHGFVAVLDLHRSAPGSARSLEQEQMPDRDHSVQFWREVARAYKDDPSVVFDLFNEPWPFAEVNSARAWRCWRDGGCRLASRNGGGTYVAAGMAELVAAVRAAGAPNLVLLAGVHWGETLDRWLEHRPPDPLQNTAAAFHNYAHNRSCAGADCYDTVLAEVVARVPLVATEIGPDGVGPDCATPRTPVVRGFSQRILGWLDRHGASYTPWSWNAWNDGCSLVTDHSGTPTRTWGREVRARLAANAG